ncbi:peptidoglycan editing factor PgeF [Acidipila sp. EB88]|uniref:peptidoglycan editing factor PgeF n=1 Tax=Acidipila sp. EB88 TaxID=2305226 RepID=UPI000F604294|nr:peptidoglycan editing factor PgeF [Acidipila sp. EB88]RRA47772.1 peptidoglycan editing factor PgeF [Acidipila sp. EB88]
MEQVQPGRSHLLDEALAATPIRHGFSTRKGGVSTVYQRPYNDAPQPGARPDTAAGSEVLPASPLAGTGDLNLGLTASDPVEAVLENRRRLVAAVFGVPRPLVTLRQVHSDIIHTAGAEHAHLTTLPDGDGILTDTPGVALGIQTADCVPILIADPTRGAVGAFHAGWRGTLAAIVEQGVARMHQAFGSRPGDLVAAIGPAIRPCCYQVGHEVVAAFRARFSYADALLSHPAAETAGGLAVLPSVAGEVANTLALDLQEANRQQLLTAGLHPGSIDVLAVCTCCNPDQYFSYRGENGFTGRMMAVIGS